MTDKKTVHEILNSIQKNLKAPKSQYNAFGNYKYRSCEDILEAVKPLLGDAILILGDSVEMVGDRYYIKASALLSYEEKEIVAYAFARESLDKKGMDGAQVTGAASSYARKYALSGLFAIDDTRDADSTNIHSKTADKSPKTAANSTFQLPGDYIPKFGQWAPKDGYAGTKIQDIPKDKIFEYLAYIEQNAEEKGEKIDGIVKELFDNVKGYYGDKK